MRPLVSEEGSSLKLQDMLQFESTCWCCDQHSTQGFDAEVLPCYSPLAVTIIEVHVFALDFLAFPAERGRAVRVVGYQRGDTTAWDLQFCSIEGTFGAVIVAYYVF